MSEQPENDERERQRYRLNEDLEPPADHDAAVLKAIADTSARIKRRRWMPLATAASVLIAFGLGALMLPGGDSGAPVMRNKADTATPSGYELLATPPRELKWLDSLDDAPYTVEMFDQTGTELWEVNNVAEPMLSVSDTNLQQIDSTATYYWVVTTADGAELGPYWFRVDVP